MTTFLLMIVTLNSVAFAPTPFASEAECKAAAGEIAQTIARADQNGAGARLSCVPVTTTASR